MSTTARFIHFWYPNSFTTLIRVWHNIIIIIEEDLAVGLMYRLIFVPLFHETSFVGKIVSFSFRLSRIILGLFAYFIVTVVLLILAIVWFLWPLLLLLCLLIGQIHFLLWPLFGVGLFGVALFIDKMLIDQPLKKVWQIKSVDQLWQASKLKKNQITWEYLTATSQVQELLWSLELKSDFISKIDNTTPQIFSSTLELAKNTKAVYISPAHFWLSLLFENPNFDQEILKFGLEKQDFIKALEFLEFRKNNWRKVFIWDDDFSIKHLKGVNRGWLGTQTPILDQFCQDLTRIAVKAGFPDFIGRRVQLAQVNSALSQSQDRNVLLVGPPGSGRSTLVNFLAKIIVIGDAPDALISKRIVELNLPGLLSGVDNQAELAQKIELIFKEIQASGNIIVFIDEIHTLGMGEAGQSYNLFSLILPYLESDTFQFVASTESENYSRIIAKSPSLARIFHKVELPPASIDDTMEILQDKSLDLARYSKVNITYKAIKELVAFSKKLVHDLVLPDSALSVLNECLPLAKNGVVDSVVIKEVFENRLKVPVVELNQEQKQLLLHLEEIVHQKFINQNEAVKAVADTLRRFATALRESNRPVGSFMFVGPTGVGKTELAKILAQTFFKTPLAFVRFDMSEYQTTEAADRLIGTMQTPGELTEIVASKPYCLLLLDEFEKADKKILNLFLQVLEEGSLTDGSGKTIDFSNTIIIATSNVGSLEIAEGLRKGLAVYQLEEQVKMQLLKIYTPELLNRFDNIVIFKSLSQQDLQKVVKIKLEDLGESLKKQGYLIEFDDKIIDFLAKNGYDPVMGARPLRRLIQDTIESKLSKLILENKITKGQKYISGTDILNQSP